MKTAGWSVFIVCQILLLAVVLFSWHEAHNYFPEFFGKSDFIEQPNNISAAALTEINSDLPPTNYLASIGCKTCEEAIKAHPDDENLIPLGVQAFEIHDFACCTNLLENGRRGTTDQNLWDNRILYDAAIFLQNPTSKSKKKFDEKFLTLQSEIMQTPKQNRSGYFYAERKKLMIVKKVFPKLTDYVNSKIQQVNKIQNAP